MLDALLDASRWDDVLRELAATVGARAALLMTEGWRDGRPLPAASLGLDVAALEDWARRGLHHDVMVRASLDLPVGVVIRDHEVIGGDRFRRCELVTSLLAPSGLLHVAGASLRLGDPGYGAVWFYRAEDDGPFLDDLLPQLRRVVQQLRQALEVHYRLMATQQQVLEARAALDRITVAAITVDGDGRPLGMNRSARRLLEARDGIGLGDGGLVGRSSTDTHALRATVGAAVAGNGPVRAMRLPRASAGRDLEVIATSLGHGALRGGDRRAAGVVFVIDPEEQPAVSPEVLEDLYGLTPAEARLACLLPRCGGLGELAEELGVSLSTARTQLAAVFRKTGARRQADLVRLLVQGAAMVRSVEESSGFWFVRPAPGADRG